MRDTQYGLTATNFIKTIQQTFYEQGIYSSSRDCYRSESGILNLILERGQHLEGIIIDRNFCPYKSLEAFTPQDQDFFFGRESLIDDIINKLETKHFLLVMGASGSGKSSLVQAGVVPRLLNKGLSDPENACNIWILRPGKYPVRELAEVLSQQNLSSQLEGLCKALEQNQLSPKDLEGIVNSELEQLVTCLHQQLHATAVLVINQFEELFTNSSDVEQRLFLQLILGAVKDMKGNLKIIVTLRSDFLSYWLEIPELGEKVKEESVFVPSYLTEAEYRQIITNPAKRVGLAVEPELVNVLVEEVLQEKGALPLLEFTLEQLWQNRVGGKLSLEVYQQRIGGIRQVLQDKADSVYQELTSSQQECAEWIFTQLVRLGEGTEDTRRRRNLSELIVPKYPQKLIESTLDVLIKSRLIVMSNLDEDLINNRQKKRQTRVNSQAPEPVQLSRNSEVTVEIAHEILIRTWQQLREWLKNNREFCTWQERLNTRMQEWKENQGELLSKTRLKIAEYWRQKRGQELSSEQENFIKKSQQKQMRQWWLGRGIASVIIIISLWTGAEFYKRSCEVGERIGQDCFRFIITSGDSLLFVGTTNHFLQDGVKNFANKKFQDAEQDFAKAQNAARFDPIPLIYYNNAKALKKGNPYKLAVVVPVDAHEEIARNMLRGVASAQEEFNKEQEKSGSPLLEIVIANDKNNQDISKKIARRLIQKNVLGIIGHRSSGSSLAALPIYEKRGISMVSPTSGSTKLDQSPVFFRTIASNEEFAKDFYEYAKEQCFNDNKDNYIWLIYDSDAEYSNNLKDKFDEQKSEGLEELKEGFDEISLNYLSNKNLNELEIEIKQKIDDGVRCTILLPSTKTASAAISIVYAQNNLKLLTEQKMQFLSGLALHNDETLKRDGSSFGEDLKIVVPIPLLDEPIIEEIQDRWKNNINWRTYTSYKATQYLIGGLKELDGKEPDEKNTTSKKREIVLQYLKDQKNSSDKDLESCLMDSKDIQDNKYDRSNCIKPRVTKLTGVEPKSFVGLEK